MDDKLLLPCPFCGGEALMRERYINGIANTKHYRRECRHCKATFAHWYRSMKKADEAWNRRVQPKLIMNIPEKVKIGWREYEIVQGEHRTGADGGDLYGEISYENNKIYIYDKLDADNKAVALLHEIIHGIFYFAGRTDNRNDEGLIECLSENLYQVIKENPKLFAPPDKGE